MTPVQRKIVEWIINYESNHSEDDSGPVNADALRACLAAADRCASAEAGLARVTAERDAARADIAQLRAIIARMSAEMDEAIEDRRQARDDAARAAALLAVRTMERDKARSVGEAVLAVLEDFGWDLAVLRADIESERLAETVEGCVMLAIERALRAHTAGSGNGGDDG